VELLRTKADNITHALNSINEDGSDADSEEKKDQIKEANRYQIDECTTVPPPEGWSKKGRRPKTDKPQDEDDAPEAEADQPIELQVEPEAKYHMGHIKMAPQMWAQLRMHEATEAELAATPASFDVRERNSCKSHVIVDQGSCGSCWAFAASRVYSDRLCFKTNGATDITLSEQDILSCYTHGGYYPRTGVTDNGQTVTQYYRLASASTSDGCNGGSSAVAWMQMTGAAGGRVSRWADPYTGKGYQQDACGSHENAIEYKVGTDSIGARVFKLPANEASIKHAISSSGSISAGFDVYSCIMNFRGSTGLGIYTKSSSSYQGGHAVGVIGYGSDGGTDYWIMANSWGTGWGNNGYARIVRMTNGVDFEGEMSYPDPVVPDTCKDVAPCKNGGEFDGSCRCKCDSATQWSGADCNTCSASCENGGTVNAQSCSCNCADGYFGPTCSSYALLQWKSLSGSTGVLKASWSLDHSYTGSYYSRMAGPEGENGENTRISGTNQVASGRTGSVDITVNVLSYIPGYPTGMHYVFMESMGTNEFGASRGFKTIRIPSMFYDSTNRCVKGGHKPSTSVSGLCADAFTGSPVAPSTPSTNAPTNTPVAPSTNAPVTPSTRSPTNTPTNTPVAPSTNAPVTDPAPSPSSQCHITMAGRSSKLSTHPVTCSPDSEKHYVRCCPKTGTAKVPMSEYGCNAGKTYSEANNICTAAGLRLCTQDLIAADRTAGTGCGYDSKRIWTSTTTTADTPPPFTLDPTAAPIAPATHSPSKNPTSAPDSLEENSNEACEDLNPTGLQFSDGSPAPCTSLKSWCSHSLVAPRCPKTCGGCGPTPAPTSPPPPLPVPSGSPGPMCNGKTAFVNQCGNCVSSVQCKQGFCCPYMKKCVPDSSTGCTGGATGFGSCRPVCHDALNCPSCANQKYPNQWVNCELGDASGI
jgi:cathepsin B